MNLQPRQFTQQTLLPGQTPSVTRGAGGPIEMGTARQDRRLDQRGEVEFQTRTTLHGGGSMSSWDSQARLANKAGNAARWKSEHERADELDRGQLSMLMDPQEIHQRYQPLDGDREHNWDGDLEDDEELWSRKAEEARMPPDDYAEARGEERPGFQTYLAEGGLDELAERSSYPQPRDTNHQESSSFWQKEDSYLGRKRDEYEAETTKPSLYDSIRQQGVRDPIHLGQAHGQEGKPMVVGGHHRLASQTEIDSETLVPVVHHENIFAAQRTSKGGYKYT